MSAYSGEIEESYVSEGDYVEVGQVLFQISTIDLELQREQIIGMIQTNQDRIMQYEKLEGCIKDGVNRFDENNSQDKSFFINLRRI